MKNNNASVIVSLLLAGKTYDFIMDCCQCTRPTVSYHANKIGLGTPRKVIDWNEFQRLYDTGLSMTECAKALNISKSSCTRAFKSGKIQLRNKKLPYSHIFVCNSSTTRRVVKSHIIREGLLKNECSECKQDKTWNGKPLVMVLDHINGINNDNRIENLRMLCPNCNSQMDTFAGRNTKRK